MRLVVESVDGEVISEQVIFAPPSRIQTEESEAEAIARFRGLVTRTRDAADSPERYDRILQDLERLEKLAKRRERTS